VKTKEDENTMIKCADCLHCKMYREVDPTTGRYILKARCSKGCWLRAGRPATCDLHRVVSRRRAKCPDYVSTSKNEEDRRNFLRDLANSLPVERIIYDKFGEPVDLNEEPPWQVAM